MRPHCPVNWRFIIAVCGWGLGLAAPVARAAEPLAVARTNGSLAVSGFDKGAGLGLDFGLPAQAPEQCWSDDDGLPMLHQRWEKGGIRYHQTLMLTRLGEGCPSPSALGEAVLWVRVSGENLATDYTNATAKLAARLGGQPVPLTLAGGMVMAHRGGNPEPLAILDLPAGAAAATNGATLEFEGHMPPGTSGAMVLKLPLFRPLTPEQIERIKFLEYDDEWQRLKKAWARRDTNQPGWFPFRAETSAAK